MFKLIIKEGDSRNVVGLSIASANVVVGAELTCGWAYVHERTQIRADPDRDARQANIMYAA